MNIVRVIEVAVILIGLLMFIMQITIPLWRGRPMFPLFRREQKLQSKLSEIEQAWVEKALQKRIDRESEGLNEAVQPTKKEDDNVAHG